MAQAVPAVTRSSFVAQLLAAPAPAASRAGRRFLAELRREAERAWSLAHHRFWAAQAYSSHCAHARRAAEIERRSLDVPEAAEAARAELALVGAVNRMMDVPAPTIGALRQKEKLRGFHGGRARWDAAIAADRKAFGMKEVL